MALRARWRPKKNVPLASLGNAARETNTVIIIEWGYNETRRLVSTTSRTTIIHANNNNNKMLNGSSGNNLGQAGSGFSCVELARKVAAACLVCI